MYIAYMAYGVHEVRFNVTQKKLYFSKRAGVSSNICDDFYYVWKKYILPLQRENFGKKILPIWGNLR